MRIIAVILPINNPDILKQSDLEPYQSNDVNFRLSYVDTQLREINTAEEAEVLLPLVVKKIQEAEHEGADAVIVYAFAEFGVTETEDIVKIPVMALGKAAIHEARNLSSKKFTVLPGMLAHNEFLKTMIETEKLGDNYVPAIHSPEVTPAEIRKDQTILK